MAAPTFETDQIDAFLLAPYARGYVRAATTQNITLSGVPQTIDQVTINDGDRVLVKNQTTGSQNGIYLAKTGSWMRSADADISAKVVHGIWTYAKDGTANGSKYFF